jgi:hypothetical protein
VPPKTDQVFYTFSIVLAISQELIRLRLYFWAYLQALHHSFIMKLVQTCALHSVYIHKHVRLNWAAKPFTAKSHFKELIYIPVCSAIPVCFEGQLVDAIRVQSVLFLAELTIFN